VTGTLRRPPRRRTRPDRTVIPVRQTVSTARVVVVAGALVAVVGALAGRLVDLQLTPDARIIEEVSIPRGEITIPAPRGGIVDRHGRTIAMSLPAATIYADPRLIEDPRAVANSLVPVLGEHGIDVESLTDLLSQDGAFVYLARQLDPGVGERVLALDLPGVRVLEEPRREHPNGDCSGLAVVGRVNVDHVGMSGLEEALEDRLSGESGRVVKEVGTDGTTIPGGEELVVPAVPGDSVQVTLDRNIQFRAEELLIETVEATRAERGVALVAVPATGEIVAMANVSRAADGAVGCTRENLAATWSYEPGSIIKPATISGVVGYGIVGEYQPITVEPGITRWDHDFRDDPWHDVVEWTPTDILTQSSNVGTILLAEALGAERLHDTLTSFGFGSTTALGFKGEASGILDPVDEWNGLTLSNVAIGQGVAVTPLQMLQVYNTIANDGVRVDPTLLAEEIGSGSQVQVVDAATAAAVQRMMTSVVQNGTGSAADVAGYVMSGKTGTAWQPCDEGYECHDETGRHYTASFAGVVSNDLGPALTVMVIIDRPRGEVTSGGRVAAPVVSELAGYAVRQLRIPAATGATPDDRQRAQPATPQVAPPNEAGA
jgi:cell division protein FtsI (penicillin-binding protein 3)